MDENEGYLIILFIPVQLNTSDLQLHESQYLQKGVDHCIFHSIFPFDCPISNSYAPQGLVNGFLYLGKHMKAKGPERIYKVAE